MRKDELKKRSKGVAFVIALLVLTTSLSQCHKEPDEELLETINDSDNLDNEHHVIDDGSLDASKNNEHEHTHDFSVEESTEEASIKDIAPESSSEASTSNNVNSNNKDNKKKDKGKEDSSTSASTLASIIENIIAPIIPSNDDTNNQESNNDNSNSGSESDHEESDNKDDNKGWHIHVWGPWKDNGSNEIRTCLLNSSHTQTRNHSYGAYTYDPNTGKDSATCSQCGHVDQRDHLHHWGDWTDNGTNEIRRCNDDSSHSETRNHSYGAYVYDATTGKEVATCSQCGHKEYKNHVHTMGSFIYNPSTGLEESTCSVCGHKDTRAHTHTWGEWTDNGSNEIRYCTVDHNHSETRNHTMGTYAYNSVSGKDEAHCSTCSHVDSKAHEHHYGADQTEIVGSADVCYKTYHVCSDCSNKEYTSTVTSHTMSGYSYNSQSGLEESTCSKCGYVATQAHTNHHWVQKTEEVQGDGTVCYRTYNECSDCHTKVDIQDHNHGFGDWQDNGDNEIRYCTHNSSHTETQYHSWSVEVVGTTKTSTCSSCNAVRTETVECQHDWQYRERTVNEGDTCWISYDECSLCHETRNEENHGHNYVDIDDGWGNVEFRCDRCNKIHNTLGSKNNKSPLDIYLKLLDSKKTLLASLQDQIDFYYEDVDKVKVLKKSNKERV